MISLSRKQNLAEKIVFVDGLPGCGKTLFSQIVASFDKVELLSYIYEIEHMCSLYYLNQISLESAANLINIQADLKIYNTMMGRDVNFRYSDLSSVANDHDPSRYLKRLSGPGDKEIPKIIKENKPILNLTVHNLLAYSEPIWEAFGDRCIFIEVIRHPIYMIRQQALNMDSLIQTARDFTVYFEYKELELPYYVKSWEEDFLVQNPYERSINFIYQYNQKLSKIKENLIKKNKLNVLTIPFELFVINPDEWIDKIEEKLEVKAHENINQTLINQNVPRDKVADGVDLEIYRRCGWKPPLGDASERDELKIRREEILMNVNSEMATILDKICAEYEKKYWRPDE